MLQSLAQVRKWLIWTAVSLLLVVTVSYFYARSRVKVQLHNVPKSLGLDIQQTSEGFTLSKSEGGRTLYTIRASNAVQFKKGNKADLKNVNIVVYGKTHDRYDQIYGKEFTYDPQSGDITGLGEVHIDLQGYAEGPSRPDQAPPAELKNPVHIVANSLTFNQKTGIGHTDEVVQFRTLQASGTAKGADYDSNTNQLQLKSDVHLITTGDNAADIVGSSGTIQRDPRQAVLLDAAIYQPDRTLTADKLTMFFEPDNSIQHAQAEGNVNIEVRGTSIIDITGPRGDLNMGPDNAIQQAIVSGGARFNTRGENLSHGSADTFILDFIDDNQPKYFHMVNNAVVQQDPQPGKPASAGQQTTASQPMEIAADRLDFVLTEDNGLQTGDTGGKAKITILPAPSAAKSAKAAPKSNQGLGSASATTVATAGKFHANFAPGNRIVSLHGSPDARVVSTTPGEPDKTSTSQNLDLAFAPDGGVEKLIQTGNFEYHEPSGKPDVGGRAVFADKATYTPADQILVLNGSPRAIDGGTTTTADVLRLNRQSGEAFADGNVKSTYSDLKPQPDGALLASSDPIHVTAAHMTSKQQPGVAHYSGNVRLWQGANILRAPFMDFDQSNRTIVAHGDTAQSVSSLFLQQGEDGKQAPVDVTADKMTYVDSERRARYTGNVLAKSPTATISGQQIDVYLKPSETAQATAAAASSIFPGSEGPSRIDHMIVTGNVVATEPNRRATGSRLVYTADDGKYVLTGKNASIYDAGRGQVWGDSLTFYSHDDRVLVESKASSPTITKARITK